MELWIILLVLLVVLLIASVPAYPYSAGWGYFPSGLIAVLLVVFVVLLLTGVLDFSGGNSGDGGGIDVQIEGGNGGADGGGPGS